MSSAKPRLAHQTAKQRSLNMFPLLQSPVTVCFTPLHPTLGIVLCAVRFACGCWAMETHPIMLPPHSFCADINASGSLESADNWLLLRTIHLSTRWPHSVTLRAFPLCVRVGIVPQCFHCPIIRNIEQGWNFLNWLIANVASYQRTMLEFMLFRMTHLIILVQCNVFMISHICMSLISVIFSNLSLSQSHSHVGQLKAKVSFQLIISSVSCIGCL